MDLKESLDSHEVTVAWNCLTEICKQAESIEDYLNYSADDGIIDVAYIQSELKQLLSAVKVQYSILEKE